jgi:hypothetical protein
MAPNEKFLLQLIVTGVLIPVVFLVTTVAIRSERKGPLPSWADAAAIAACFDIVALASGKDWNMMFANPQIQEMAGVVLATLLGLSLLVWLMLLTVVELANERNFIFDSNRYVSYYKRGFHWFAGTAPVILLFAIHLVPLLLPREFSL